MEYITVKLNIHTISCGNMYNLLHAEFYVLIYAIDKFPSHIYSAQPLYFFPSQYINSKSICYEITH